MPKCGNKPGIGHYICMNCGKILFLDEETDTLPPCKGCNKCDFRRKCTFTRE